MIISYINRNNGLVLVNYGHHRPEMGTGRIEWYGRVRDTQWQQGLWLWENGARWSIVRSLPPSTVEGRPPWTQPKPSLWRRACRWLAGLRRIPVQRRDEPSF